MNALLWGIKASLIGYMRGLGDGEVSLIGVTETPDGFLFPAEEGPGQDADPKRRRAYDFSGSVTLTAHNGLLHLTFSNPRVVSAGEGWNLLIDDDQSTSGHMVFATIKTLTPDEDGSLRASGTHLTSDGSDLFFGPYEEGTDLDDPVVLFQP